jgi:hypothetical protein
MVASLLIVAGLLSAFMVVPVVRAEPVDLTLNINGLSNLGPNHAYEGWLIVDGTPVSTGIFAVDDAGALNQTDFTVDVDDMDAIDAFVLTIEPAPDDDPAPSDIHVLGGDFTDGTAQLSAAHGGALGVDLADASGTYILNAPSGGDAAEYYNGIWWLTPEGPAATLDLPELPAGWVYEGWVVAPEDGPISTGRFTMVSGADSDGAGPTSGPNEFPPFPGQDFVDPARDLTDGYSAVISIEPEPDNSPAPYAFKPLVDQNIEDVGAGTPQQMTNNAGAFPTGAAALGGEMADPGTAPEMLPEAGATGLSTPFVLGIGVAALGVLMLGAALLIRRR